MAKRVLIFSLAYYPKHVGGAEVAIREITDRIDPHEIEFHMVCLRFDSTLPKVEQVGNVRVHRIGPTKANPTARDLKRFPLHFAKALYQLYAAFYALRLHHNEHYDSVWAMMAHSCGIPAALFKTFASRVRYVQTLQEGDPPEHIERMMRPAWPLFKRAFTRADAVQVISSFLGNWARRMGATCPVVLVPNGVDVQCFEQEPASELLSMTRTAFGYESGDVWLIHTGRLVHKNALDTVIWALSLCPPHVHLLLVGDGPLREDLAALAEELGVASRVRFLPYVPLAEIPHYLHVCDIFIRPSRSEGMGISFIEAMAAGLPVIATQEGGISDFLFDAERNSDKPTTGFAVDVDVPEQIAQKIQHILKRPDEVAEVTRCARAMVREKYDWDLLAKEMRGILLGE